MTDADRVEHAATAARDPRTRRWWTILAAWMALSIAALGVFLIYQYAQSQQLRQQLGDVTSGESALFSQVRALGATPVTSPPVVVTGVQGIPGLQGPAGVAGAQGLPGPSGPAGPAGATGPTGPTGLTGAAGVNGAAGASGQPGAAGPSGPQGPPGQSGTNGQPPYEWTATYPDGSTETCTRAANFDPSAPRYSCTVQAPPTTTTTTTTGLLVGNR